MEECIYLGIRGIECFPVTILLGIIDFKIDTYTLYSDNLTHETEEMFSIITYVWLSDKTRGIKWFIVWSTVARRNCWTEWFRVRHKWFRCVRFVREYSHRSTFLGIISIRNLDNITSPSIMPEGTTSATFSPFPWSSL